MIPTLALIAQAEANKAIVQRFIAEAWGRNPAICDELLCEDYKHFMPGVEDPWIGPGPYKQLIHTFVAGFPDAHMQINEIFSEGHRVRATWTFTGTNNGEFQGAKATGRAVKVDGVAVVHLRNGQISQIISAFDSASLASQLQG